MLPSRQILVIGPWPCGLLQELYYCVEALAQGVPGLTVYKPHVVCQRCRGTKVRLKSVRTWALKGCRWPCGRLCAALPPAGPGVTVASLGPWKGSDSSGHLDMGTLGFAAWTVGLGDNKRQRVVALAIQKVTEAGASKDGVSLSAQAAHACRILQR